MPTDMGNIEYIEYISSSDSDSDLNFVSRVMPITELATRRPKRRRLESANAPGSYFSCSGCDETLKADGRVYFLPFCGCLYCGRCVVQSILDGLLHLKSALGRAAVDLVRDSANHGMKLPTSSINLLVCKKREHLQIPGAVECYGTACSICTLKDSLSDERVYLSCGHPFCKSHITKWFNEKGKRACPTCRSDVPEEDAHFKKDGTYALCSFS